MWHEIEYENWKWKLPKTIQVIIVSSVIDWNGLPQNNNSFLYKRNKIINGRSISISILIDPIKSRTFLNEPLLKWP